LGEIVPVIINNNKQSTSSVVPTVTSILDSGVGIGTAVEARSMEQVRCHTPLA